MKPEAPRCVEGCCPGNGNVGQSFRSYLWQDNGILGMPICSQYCFRSTFLVFSLNFGPDPKTWTSHSLTTHHTGCQPIWRPKPTSGGTFTESSQASPFLEAISVHWAWYLEHLELTSASGYPADLGPGFSLILCKNVACTERICWPSFFFFF